MTLPDVNVLIASFQEEHQYYSVCRPWLERMLRSDQAYGISELTLTSFTRIVTNHRAVRAAVTLDEAFQFCEAIVRPVHAVRIAPGTRHWDIFRRLCLSTHIRGDVVSDAYYAALAIEHGCEWITLDSDFARFKGLRWRRPE